MGFASHYLGKQHLYAWSDAEETWPQSAMLVVIPCFNEPDLDKTIFSLAQCEAPDCHVTVLLVINQPENAPASVTLQNEKTYIDIGQWKNEMPAWLNLTSTTVLNLPHKHAGAGYARKIGMDGALAHLNHFDRPEGLIVSLDADCMVERNYLKSIETHFNKYPAHIASTIYFEHPLDEAPAREAMVLYELSMRYYRNALAACRFPNAIYTVGSCFVVKAHAYAAQGGMNRRKAGEDFYFLYKLLPFGPIGHINNTTVYPSARFSNRVPFGTGPLLLKAQEGRYDLTRYHPLSLFETLGCFFRQTDNLYAGKKLEKLEWHHSLFFEFCAQQKVFETLGELRRNCATLQIFNKRFFHVFNAFMVLKWLHFAKENGIENTLLFDDASRLAVRLMPDYNPENITIENLLLYYRAYDKAGQNN